MTTRFTKDHEYVRLDGKTGVVGISDYAQDQLGDVVFVELPEIGKTLSQGEEAAVVESVKAASEIYAPVSGTVVAVNEALADNPGLINAEPDAGGWLFKLEITDQGQFDALMDAAAYSEFTH